MRTVCNYLFNCVRAVCHYCSNPMQVVSTAMDEIISFYALNCQYRWQRKRERERTLSGFILSFCFWFFFLPLRGSFATISHCMPTTYNNKPHMDRRESTVSMSSVTTDAQTHTGTHSQTQAHINTKTPTPTHTHTRTHSTLAHSHTHSHSHTHTPTHTHTLSHSHIHRHTQAHTPTCTNTLTHTRALPQEHAQTHSHTRTLEHAHKQTNSPTHATEHTHTTASFRVVVPSVRAHQFKYLYQLTRSIYHE